MVYIEHLFNTNGTILKNNDPNPRAPFIKKNRRKTDKQSPRLEAHILIFVAFVLKSLTPSAPLIGRQANLLSLLGHNGSF